MKTPHTPGPWQVETWHYEKRGDVQVIKTETDAIAEVYELWVPDERHEERDANARLIAAAPDAYALADMILELGTFSDATWMLNREKVLHAAIAFLNTVEGIEP